MGWGRFLLLGNLGQQLDIQDQNMEIQHLRNELARQRNSSPIATSLPIKELQKENDELKLYIAALVKILITKGVATSDEIKQMVQIIDSQDGSQDGKLTGDINP